MSKLTKERSWGFRFSVRDAMALALFTGSAAVLQKANRELWWLLLITAGHFFLFCNIFRLPRPLELIWAGFFLLNVAMWAEQLSWQRVMICQIPVTAILVVIALKSARYHGVFANRLNPRLNDYLEERIP